MSCKYGIMTQTLQPLPQSLYPESLGSQRSTPFPGTRDIGTAYRQYQGWRGTFSYTRLVDLISPPGVCLYPWDSTPRFSVYSGINIYKGFWMLLLKYYSSTNFCAVGNLRSDSARTIYFWINFYKVRWSSWKK